MTEDERLERARRSLASAIARKYTRDVSDEILSLIANLTAAQAPFAAIDTTEHEVLAVLGLGFFSGMKAIAGRTDKIPRPHIPTRAAQMTDLLKRTEEAYAIVAAKIDADTASFIEQNDPFLRAMREGAAPRSTADMMSLFKDVNVDSLFPEALPDDGDDDGPVLEVSDEMIELSDDYGDVIEISTVRPRTVPPPLPLYDGIADSEEERRFFEQTG